MNKKLIFITPLNWAKFPKAKFFNGDFNQEQDIHPTLTEEWIFERFNIWSKFTYKSLLNQTCQDFEVWFKADWRTRHILNYYFGSLKDNRLKFLYRDEFDPDWGVPGVPKSLNIQTESQILQTTEDCDIYHLCLCDSDDMYYHRAVEQFMSESEVGKFYRYVDGYSINFSDLSVKDIPLPAPWGEPHFYSWTCGPNFKKQGWNLMNDASSLPIIQPPPHQHINSWPNEIYTEKGFAVLRHDSNTSRMAQNLIDAKGVKEYTNQESKLILKTFGL